MYDLKKDPNEIDNLAEIYSQFIASSRLEYLKMIKKDADVGRRFLIRDYSILVLDAEIKEQLRALGYTR